MVAFSGAAAAVNDSINANKDIDPTSDKSGKWNVGLNSSGGPFWQGQKVVFQIQDRDNQKVQIRETESTDNGERVGTFVQEVSLNGTGEYVLNTANLEGSYVLTKPGGSTDGTYVIEDAVPDTDESVIGSSEQDADGTLEGDAGDAEVSVASFEVTAQNVNIGFQSDESAQEEIYLEADSARSGYDVLVEADGLDDSDIINIFKTNGELDSDSDGDQDDSVTDIVDVSDSGSGYSTSSDGVVFEGVSGDANITANFSGIDTGDYEFSFEVTDTGVTDTSTVTVTEEDDVDAEILRGGVATAAQGDFAVIPIRLEETDEARVNVGFNDVNFNATFRVEDGNDDGVVTVEMNTFIAGRNDGNVPSYVQNAADIGYGSSYPAGVSDWSGLSENLQANVTLDAAISADDNEDTVTSSPFSNSSGLGMVGGTPDDLSTPTADVGIDGPMEPDQYDVNVTANGDELDVGTIQVVEPQVVDIKSWTMPGDVFSDVEEDETAEIYEYAAAGELTQTNSVAEEDVLVYQIQSTSMFGALKFVEDAYGQSFAESLNTISSYDDDGTEEFKFSIEQTEDSTSANQQEKELVLSASDDNGMKVVPDERNSSLFVVLQEDNVQLTRTDLEDATNFGTENPSGNWGAYLGSAGLGMDDGESYVANWTTLDSSDIGDETQTVTDTASIVEKSIDFDTDQGDVIRVAAAQGQVISGSTSVAPGTELNIRLRSTGDSPFLEDPEATVTENGTFTTTVDLSDRAQNASFVANAQGFDEDYDTPGVIGSAPTAQVTFDDQEVSDGTVEVTGTMSEGGFIAIHSGSASGEIIGNSEYLSPGEFTTEVEISPLSGNTTLVAMAHLDTNGNEAFDFAGSGTADGPYVLNGSAVIDSATISPETTDTPDTDTPDMDTDTPDMDTDTPEPETDAPATEAPAETTTQTGPGFTAVLALVALVAAALLAVRRRD